jgi:hypothetical protein
MAKSLAHFTVEPNDDGYLLRIEDEDGDTLELVASADQLDIIAEAIDNRLDEDSDENDVIAEDE